MGRCYGQLSLEERIEIYRLHAGGKSQNKIAAALGRAPSTISRELDRNSQPSKIWRGGYEPVRAQQLAERRRRWDCRFKLARQADLRHCVGNALRWDIPQNRSPADWRASMVVSSSATSQSIVLSIIERPRRITGIACCLDTKSNESGADVEAAVLPALSSAAARSANVPPRPKAALRWGIGRPTSCCSPDTGRDCFSHERKTRFNIAKHTVDRTAVLTARSIGRQLEKLPKAMRKTISFDNGTEFAEHHRLHQPLGVQTFFCDPHSPWQKGGIENAIGRIRRSLPRKTDLKSISTAALNRIIERLNNTPRKCLDFKTPAEAFSELKSTVALQT